MNFRDQLHRFADNREIDYVSAKNLGEMNGMKFKNEGELIEWKKSIDDYLLTFQDEALKKVEEACSNNKKKNKSKNNDKTMPVAEAKGEERNYTSYAKDEMEDEKPKKKRNKKVKKESKESFGNLLREYEEGKKVTIKSKESLVQMIDNADTQSMPQQLKVRMKKLIDRNKVEDALKLAIKNLTSGKLTTSKMTKDVKDVSESVSLGDMFN